MHEPYLGQSLPRLKSLRMVFLTASWAFPARVPEALVRRTGITGPGEARFDRGGLSTMAPMAAVEPGREVSMGGGAGLVSRASSRAGSGEGLTVQTGARGSVSRREAPLLP